ncbi:MAG TPA: RHS repeat-associated core domain-containing protein [Acidobacteriaceae bacterium]|nr:RHS repeat-associated core domain-containing protein [Acidobacteriaceae bacterium]
MALLMFSGGAACVAQSVTAPVPTTINAPVPTISSAEPVEMNSHEKVSLATGAVSFFLPVVSLPQRGGQSLNIGFVLSGNNYALRETGATYVSVEENQGDIAQYTTTIQGRQTLSAPWIYVLHPNFPTLSADESYAGFDAYQLHPNTPPPQWYNIPEYCMQNWTFVDWDGSSHSFPGTRDCTFGDGEYYIFHEQFPLSTTVVQSNDDGLYILDATNTNDIRVTRRDGTVYHFGNYVHDPTTPLCQNLGCGSMQDDTQLNFYSVVVSSIVDPNGNALLTATSAGWVDSLGRVITQPQNNSGYTIAYEAQAGGSTAAMTSASVSALPNNGTMVPWPISYGQTEGGPCQMLTNPGSVFDQNGFSNPTVIYEGPGGTQESQYEATTSYVITLQNQSKYTLTFDVMGNLIKVQYPSGGYTRYDYLNGGGVFNKNSFGDVTCNVPVIQLLAKHECTLASGSCSQSPTYTAPGTCVANAPAGGEATTCYKGLMGVVANQWNGGTQASVTDPLGNLSIYTTDGNTLIHGDSPGGSIPYYLAGELHYSGQSTLLKTVTNGFSTANCSTANGPWNLQPCTVTTTYNDASPALSTVTQYQYDAAGTGNVTQIQQYDFSGSLIKTTSAVWEHGGIYAPGTAGSTALSNMLDHVQSITMTDATTGYTNTKAFTYDARGNLEQSTTTGTNISALSTIYTPLDPYGRPTQAQDPMGNITKYSYSDSWSDATCTPPSNSSAYVTSVTNAKNQTTTYSYDSCTGELGSMKDPNGNVTSFDYDEMGRVTHINYPDGGSASTSYIDTPPNSIETTKLAAPDPNQITNTILDGFSRVSETQLSDQGAPYDYVDTTYDALGRVSTVTNPYRQGVSFSTNGLTTYGYDGLGRKTLETEPDGSMMHWCYDGTVDPGNPQTNCRKNVSSFGGTWVDNSDEAGNDWQRVSDAAGRLRAVIEPYAYETDYTDDGFNDLKQVDQWGGAHGSTTDHQRTFTYDALSRLLTAENPETGTVTYSYLASGTLCAGDPSLPCTKTDARNIQTAYTYDALNRLTKKSYSDGVTPTSLFVYDVENITFGTPNFPTQRFITSNAVGRLSVICVNISSGCQSMTAYSYDPVGRIIETLNNTPTFPTTGAVYAVSATYDLAGDRTSLTNSTGRTFNYSYDAAGRLQTASNTVSLNGTPVTIPMVSSMAYFPSGQPQTMTTETGSATITGTWGVDTRLRVTSYQNLSTANTEGTNYGYSLTYTPNSNVLTDAETAYNPGSGAASWSWNFGYDGLNRLISAQSAGAIQLGCAWTYDPFGNRLSQAPSGTGLSCTSVNTPVNANNQLSNPIYSYDAAGDILTEGGNTLTYDAEGRIITGNGAFGTTTYDYGGDGQRVNKTFGSAATEYIHDTDGALVATYVNGSYFGNFQDMWVGGRHFGEAVVASGNTSQTQNFSLNNWLGSVAAYANPSSGIPNIAYISQPFGDAQTSLFGPNNNDDIHFTGKERDGESGNDYFGARYYASTMGRFMSPDWSAKEEPVPYAKLDNPQTLNLYSYVGNNPLGKADADGHCYPWCTALIGAGIGAAAEFTHEAIQGKGFDGGKITAAAVGGAVIGVVGPAGAAAGLGAVGTAGFAVYGAVLGGATERVLTGALSSKQETPNPVPAKDVAKDAAEGLVGVGIGKAAGTIAAPIVKTAAEAAGNLAVDVARRNNDAKPTPPPPPNTPHTRKKTDEQ